MSESETVKTFNLGTLDISIDPTNGKPTLAPSAVKAVIRKHVGKVANADGKAVDGKVDTPQGEVSVAKAVKQFLNWQRATFPDAVAAYGAGIAALATAICTGKFHVGASASTANGRVCIVADYIGKLTSRTTDLETIKTMVDKLNG